MMTTKLSSTLINSYSMAIQRGGWQNHGFRTGKVCDKGATMHICFIFYVPVPLIATDITLKQAFIQTKQKQ